MTLKKNIAANYASQIYVTVAGIVLIPLYIKYMGAEAYGLVGFFAMLQACFNLLDLGLSPTIARESARYHGGAMSALEYRRLFRALSVIFCTIALLGGGLLWLLSDAVANRWLKVETLPRAEVVLAVQIMAISVALRWMCGLYRGVITGAEKLVWLSGLNSLIATGRFVLVLPVLMFISVTPQTFFGFQLLVAILELTSLTLMAYHLLPAIPAGQRIRWEWAPLKPVLKFSLSIAFTSSVWVLVTQTDKLVLSKILPLADYGYFTVAVLVASGIMIMSSPIISSIMPRLTHLQAKGQQEELIRVYRKSTQLVAVSAIPATLVLAFFPRQVLWAWTGNADLAEQTALVLTLYALGNCILTISAFPYYMQYAKGNLRLHLVGNVIFLLLLIPALIWAAMNYGMKGAGWAWLGSNALYLIVWTSVVHQKFAPGLHFKWLSSDIVRPAILPVISAYTAEYFISWSTNRLMLVTQLVFAGLTFMAFAYASANQLKFFRA